MTEPSLTEPKDPPAPELAGLGARLAAKLIDLTITAVVAFPGYLFIEFTRGWAPDMNPMKRWTDQQAYLAAAPMLAVAIYEAAVIAVVVWTGGTPGKKLCRLQVISSSDWHLPSALGAVIRWTVPLAAAAPLVYLIVRDIPEYVNEDPTPALSGPMWWLWVALGWWLLVHVSALWGSQRRGWHDMAADTIVVKAPRRPRLDQGSDLLAEWQRRRGPTVE